jgi:bacillithiol system protein YtxJ
VLSIFKKSNKTSISWNHLSNAKQLKDAIQNVDSKTVVLFKHSTRCSISSMALNRLEASSELAESPADFYFIDLIAFREISQAVSVEFQIKHESPQLIVVKNGKATYHASHSDIRPNEVLEQIALT